MAYVILMGVTGEASHILPAYYKEGGLCVVRGDNGCWNVTHYRSGLRIISADNRQHARKLKAKLLALGVDWTKGAEDLRNLPGLNDTLLELEKGENSGD